MSFNNNNANNPTAARKFTIKPFRSYTQMDTAAAQDTFSSLAAAMDEINNRNASTLSFEELYRNAYNLVLHKHGGLLYEGVQDRLAVHLRRSGGHLVRRALATAGAGGLGDRRELGRDRSRLLEELSGCWKEHRITMVMVRDIFMYMDRTYVPQNRKRPVYDLGLYLFRRVVWERSMDDVEDGLPGSKGPGKSDQSAKSLGGVASTLILQAVHQDRLDRLEDAPQRTALLRSLIHMLLELAHSKIADVNDRNVYVSDTIPVYERDFEEAFLGESQEFYRLESTRRLSTAASDARDADSQPASARYSAMEYVRSAQQRLQEESARATALDLPAPTRSALLRIAETELIDRHARTLVDMEGSGFASLLRVVAGSPGGAGAGGDDDGVVDRARIADLGLMYDLFSRVPSSVNHLRDALGERIRLDGRALVRDQENGVAPPAAFVKGVLAMRERFAAVVADALKGEKKAQKRMREAFEDFLNADARAANCLAVYVDELLRTGLRGADERRVARELDRVVVIFRYLSDKDVFEAYYKNHLARRLLGAKSGSDEAEKAMVSLLKAECGYQFTSKLEGMFNDMRISKETAEKYRSHKRGLVNAALDERDAENGGRTVDVEVSVLSNSHWPGQKNAERCALPSPVQAAMDRFQKYYLNNYTGRKLAWQTSTGTAEIRATLPSSKGSSKPRRHDLTVSTYQMCVLVLFNATDVLTLKEIRDRTNIPENELRQNLVSLCTPKHRILRKGSKGKGISGDDDTFTYNAEYASKMTKVKVPMVSMRDATGGSSGSKTDKTEASPKGLVDGSPAVPAAVEEDRRHLLEASIVRIMKARKVLSHNDLIAEVTRQLSGRFLPSPVFVKKRVESLIEREYLERDESDRKVYRYMA